VSLDKRLKKLELTALDKWKNDWDEFFTLIFDSGLASDDYERYRSLSVTEEEEDAAIRGVLAKYHLPTTWLDWFESTESPEILPNFDNPHLAITPLKIPSPPEMPYELTLASLKADSEAVTLGGLASFWVWSILLTGKVALDYKNRASSGSSD
jgi:hypothetical protein